MEWLNSQMSCGSNLAGNVVMVVSDNLVLPAFGYIFIVAFLLLSLDKYTSP